MAEARIPVDLFNPGQVIACLGFLEAAEVLLGAAEGGFDWSNAYTIVGTVTGVSAAEGGFDWSDAAPCFVLHAKGPAHPVREVLGFLAQAHLVAIAPALDRTSNETGQPAPGETADETDDGGSRSDDDIPRGREKRKPPGKRMGDHRDTFRSETFPAPRADKNHNALPVRLLEPCGRMVAELGHWWDKSGRDDFKLYSGNRSALKIARDMQCLIKQAWHSDSKRLVDEPFDTLVPIRGSFNLDPRGAWTALDTGYSPDAQEHQVRSSAVVELLAAWGLENARPRRLGDLHYAYGVWGEMLPPMLARMALGQGNLPIPMRRFRFALDRAGQNKLVTFASEEGEA